MSQPSTPKKGFCQTFMLIMYLVILHNPILAKEPLEVVMKRPVLDNIIGTKEGFLGFLDKMLEIVNVVISKYEFGRSPRRSLKSRRSKRRQSFKKQIRNKNKRVKKSNGRKKRTCAY